METQAADTKKPPDRRTFLSRTSGVAMAGGLIAGYGTLAVMAGRFLYPSEGRKLAWVFVAEAKQMKSGDSLRYETPAGQIVTVTRRAESESADDFLALSSTCPHLGCKVHWEAQNNRFFCPCHNGVFDPSGRATAGPPAEAGQPLAHFPLKIENGLLFMEVPVEAT
jgi:cytochrome b6-f complex iron-sulfur subunit